jgi:exopolyphosphatase/guanosine-5'-triphosphate,3'-diphosphate pyrophosphatase
LPNDSHSSLQACIDLGSNSFHLLIAKWAPDRIEVVERCSERVLLGEGVRASGAISPAAFERGLDCLKRFDEILSRYPIERYWALGTNTFRVAGNAQEFINAADSLGIHISPITGTQEAVLIYTGVLSGLPKNHARRLVVDIGGGSTEVIVGHGSGQVLTESLSIGSVAWRDTYFSRAHFTQQSLDSVMDSALADARKLFSKVAPAVKSAGWDEAFAASGTIKMLASICEAHGFAAGQVSQEALLTLREAFADHALSGTSLQGLKERRRDLLLAGWSVLLGVMQAYSIDTITFSATALREGMLEFMMRNQQALRIMDNEEMPRFKTRN